MGKYISRVFCHFGQAIVRLDGRTQPCKKFLVKKLHNWSVA